MTDKTKSQTYNFLSKNKSIEDIKQESNIEVIEKSRHGGSTLKIIEKNVNNQRVNDDLSENEIFYDSYDTVDDLNNISTKEISQFQTTIEEQAKEIHKLKKENEELKVKQSNVNLNKFKYNAVTIYNEKKLKNTGIKKIHEEILPIKDKIIFVTTLVHINNSITEEVIDFQELTNGNIEVMKQLKKYENINKYKDDLLLIEPNSNYEKNIKIEPLSIKEFLNQQTLEKLKPTKTEKWIWIISVVLPTIAIIIGIFHPPALIVGGIGLALKTCTSIFSSATRKVDAWFGNKFYKNKDQKDKEKKERQSIIKNLTSDKLETKLQTQYDILKQELDNKKDMKPDQLISNSTINHNSNSILENSSIESENNQNFDSSIRNTVNNQDSQPSTSSIKNWNKVKGLLTT